MLSRRRLPGSLSRRLIARSGTLRAECRMRTRERERTAESGLSFRVLHSALGGSVMAGDGLDRVDHLFVGDLLRNASEAGVATVQQDGPVAFGVAAQCVDQLPSLRV